MSTRHQLNADVVGPMLPAEFNQLQARELAEDLAAIDDEGEPQATQGG